MKIWQDICIPTTHWCEHQGVSKAVLAERQWQQKVQQVKLAFSSLSAGIRL